MMDAEFWIEAQETIVILAGQAALWLAAALGVFLLILALLMPIFRLLRNRW